MFFSPFRPALRSRFADRFGYDVKSDPATFDAGARRSSVQREARSEEMHATLRPVTLGSRVSHHRFPWLDESSLPGEPAAKLELLGVDSQRVTGYALAKDGIHTSGDSFLYIRG